NQSPAIFLFHGLGSNEEDLLQVVGEIKDVCHIFCLRGPITHSPGFAFYTFEEEGKPTQEVFDKVIAVTRDFIVEAIDEFQLNPKKIFVAGFNQGAVIAQTLCVVMGNQIKACAAMSGFLPTFVKENYYKNEMNNIRIFISHGEYDFDYPIQWSEESRNFFEEYGAKVVYKTYPVGHGVSPENILDFNNFIMEDLIDTIH
ncbi:MAG: esterase, partial [Lysinibacillus sp.]|nr:esterase [Lysinibacillus sp.]